MTNANAANPTVATGSRILFADDDAFYRDMADGTLSDAGFAVRTAAGGADAVAAIDAAACDLLIVDLEMGAVSGFDVIEHVRSRRKNADLPILVITGHEDVDSIDRAFELGATSFLAKPVNWLLLVHHVRFLLKAARTQQELRNVTRMADFLSNLKSRLVGTLVTEFQSPLKTAFAFARLIKQEADGPLPSDLYRTWISEMYEALNRVSTTHARMINFGRLLSDGIVLAEEIITIEELLVESFDGLQDCAKRRNIVLQSQNSVPAGVLLKADRSLLSQAIRIIVDRAVKLSHRGGQATVSAHLDRLGALIVRIEDTSVSLSQLQIDEIMDSGKSPAASATGETFEQITGMKMSRVIVEAHQGTIAIGCLENGGMAFTLSVPRHRLAGVAPVVTPHDRIDAVSKALSGLRLASQVAPPAARPAAAARPPVAGL